MRGPNQALAFAHSSSTPELADDEDSEGEPDGVLQRVADLHKFNDRFFRPGNNPDSLHMDKFIIKWI